MIHRYRRGAGRGFQVSKTNDNFFAKRANLKFSQAFLSENLHLISLGPPMKLFSTLSEQLPGILASKVAFDDASKETMLEVQSLTFIVNFYTSEMLWYCKNYWGIFT